MSSGYAPRFRSRGDEVFALDLSGPGSPVDVTDEAAVDAFFDARPAPARLS